MYLPRHYQAADPEAAAALVRAHPLALLVWTHADGSPGADPVPMELGEGGPHGTLRAHVARANPLWQVAAGRPVMAVFQGPQGYVSPNWYPSKAADPRTVPTWNYALVQCHGRLVVHDSRDWLHALVTRLTGHHEAAQPQPWQPWQVADAPPDYLERMLAAVVGIELEIERIEAKFKLSQNHAAPNREGVQAGLAQRQQGDDAALAALMRLQP